MEFAQRHAITDVCILVSDVERSIDFYTKRLGFMLRRRAEGYPNLVAYVARMMTRYFPDHPWPAAV